MSQDGKIVPINIVDSNSKNNKNIEKKLKINKKGYNVKYLDDAYSIAVVATTQKEAKKIGFVMLDCDWIDVRANQAHDADVDDLPIGIVHDPILAWRRGLYDWLEDYTETNCDICRNETAIERINRTIYCEKCYNVWVEG